MATYGFKDLFSLFLSLFSATDEEDIRRLGQRNLSDTQEISSSLDLLLLSKHETISVLISCNINLALVMTSVLQYPRLQIFADNHY